MVSSAIATTIMRVFRSLLAALALLACGVGALPADDEAMLRSIERLSPLQRRQLAEHLIQIRQNQLQKRSSPTGTYAPGNIACPQTSSQQTFGFIRNAANKQLNNEERDYIQRHRESRKADWADWLTNNAKLDGSGGIPGGVQNYTQNTDNLPRIGFALSGGGLRAMLVGTGVAMGFDSRNETANQRGTGGLLQLADYIAGLSGGSWATSSLVMNDWPTAQTLNDEVWDLSSNVVVPSHGKVSFYTTLAVDVKRKRDLDYGTSITDYFGLSVAQKVLNSTYENKAATTWSDAKNTSNFQQASFPFPIIIADEREPGELLISRNTSLWEFTPYEFGSWNPRVSAFIPIEILGSSLNNGSSTLPNNTCVSGFETLPWVVGTSATLFSGLYAELITSQTTNPLTTIIKEIAAAVSDEQNDISTVPNPFYGFNESDNEVADFHNLTLVDGGLDNQNVPLWPLIEPARGLDFVVAIDSSADVTNWPNGSSLWQTSLRAKNAAYQGYPFPDMPDTNTFINRGLNTRPVFFGCDAKAGVTNSGTAFNNSKTPIIAYIPSYPYVAQANVSTYKLSYSLRQSQGVLDNSVAVATLGGADDTWATCLGCAALQRSFERSGVKRPSVCDTCMEKWCWDGVTNSTKPSLAYSPATGTPEFVTSNGTLQRSPAYTGGNGSNSQADDSSSQASTDAAGRIIQEIGRTKLGMGVLTVAGFLLL
ncbi:hypothetical protein ACQY0O_006346 [Thecaphora frezii]